MKTCMMVKNGKVVGSYLTGNESLRLRLRYTCFKDCSFSIIMGLFRKSKNKKFCQSCLTGLKC